MRSKRQSLNVQLFRQRIKAIEEADTTATDNDLCLLIGRVIVFFEQCESMLFYVLRSLDQKTDFLPLAFEAINSRQTRLQFIRAFLEARQPKRATKRFQKIVQMVNEYEALGEDRDRIAHSVLTGWNMNGKDYKLICPPPHIQKKAVGAIPKYHYDKDSLASVINRIVALLNALTADRIKTAETYTKRLVERARQELAHQQVEQSHREPAPTESPQPP